MLDSITSVVAILTTFSTLVFGILLFRSKKTLADNEATRDDMKLNNEQMAEILKISEMARELHSKGLETTLKLEEALHEIERLKKKQQKANKKSRLLHDQLSFYEKYCKCQLTIPSMKLE